MRELSQAFMNDLLNVDGLLHPILERVKQDHTLMLAIRGKYINIYYRGGDLLKVTETGKGDYQPLFEDAYGESGEYISGLPTPIKSQDDAKTWVAAFPRRKNAMDLRFSEKSKAEREFQQLVVRENNYSSISNESDYFISDIELPDSGLGARFDMLAIRWRASPRHRASGCRPALIEMKYGDGALGGSAGVLKHLQNIDAFISDDKNSNDLLKMMEVQFKQLAELGLINSNRVANLKEIKWEADHKPEVIFVLANHNPRSDELNAILSNPEIEAYDHSPNFDLRFYVASFAGYALHADCMVTLAEFRELLKNKVPKVKADVSRNGSPADQPSGH